MQKTLDDSPHAPPGELNEHHVVVLARAILGQTLSPQDVLSLNGLGALIGKLSNSAPPLHYKLLTDHGIAPRDIERINDVASGRPDPIQYDKTLLSANKTDPGNAECLAALYGNRLRYCHTRNKWLVWTGAFWAEDKTQEIRRNIIHTTRARYHVVPKIADQDDRERFAKFALSSENAKVVSNIEASARGLELFATTIDQYDRNPYIVAASNVTLDLKLGQAYDPKREDYCTMGLGTEYVPGALCPRWQSYLEEVFSGDGDLIRFVQRAVGYSMSGDMREQKFFIAFGYGANGKSVFLDTLNQLLGDYAATSAFSTFDADKRSEATNDLAALKGKRLVTVIETDEDKRLSEARIKMVTGQDPISCRFLHREFFTYMPQFKLWLAVNHLPRITDTTHGMWRRIMPIPFTQRFEGKREDQLLRQKLRGEMPGILNWALAGFQEWQRIGLQSCQAVDVLKNDYRTDSDLAGQWLTECTEQGDGHRLSGGEGFSSYRAWAETMGLKHVTVQAWGRRMLEKGFVKVKTHGVMTYLGLRLRGASLKAVTDG